MIPRTWTCRHCCPVMNRELKDESVRCGRGNRVNRQSWTRSDHRGFGRRPCLASVAGGVFRSAPAIAPSVSAVRTVKTVASVGACSRLHSDLPLGPVLAPSDISGRTPITVASFGACAWLRAGPGPHHRPGDRAIRQCRTNRENRGFVRRTRLASPGARAARPGRASLPGHPVATNPVYGTATHSQESREMVHRPRTGMGRGPAEDKAMTCEGEAEYPGSIFAFLSLSGMSKNRHAAARHPEPMKMVAQVWVIA
jgi:hypothetical protein